MDLGAARARGSIAVNARECHGGPTGPCNGNTWPQSYDALGRQIFMTVSASF